MLIVENIIDKRLSESWFFNHYLIIKNNFKFFQSISDPIIEKMDNRI